MKPTLADTLRVLLPSDSDTLLLRSCVGPRDARKDALASWLDCVGDPRQELARRRPVLAPLLPLLHSAANQDDLSLPPDLVFLLGAAAFREELRSQKVRQVLSEILLAVRTAGIDVTVLKGAALAATVYAEWPLRHCHDIDLLVAPKDLAKASEVLERESLGQLRQDTPTCIEDVHLIHPSGLPIELHTHPFVRHVSPEVMEGVLSRRSMTEIAGAPTWTLSPADVLLHIGALASRFRSRAGLRWIADACSILSACPNLDWRIFVDTAAASGLSLPLFVLVEYLHSRLDAAVPEDVLKLLSNSAQHASRLDREAALFGASAGFRQLRASTNQWRSRAFLLRWRLFPTPAYLRWVFREDPGNRGLTQYARNWVRRGVRRVRHTFSGRETAVQSHRPSRSGSPQARSELHRPWMPTPQQVLLLRAALLDGDPALEAWTQWKAGGGLECIAPGSVVLLPIAYRNLAGCAVNDPVIDYARRLYQMTSLKNEQLLRGLSGLLESFEAAGIETLVMKGAALALRHYEDPGMRSMGDVDLLIRSDDVAGAVALLSDLGWRRTGNPPRNLTRTYLRARRAMNFASSSIAKLDLHWHVMDETQAPGEDDPFWNESIRTAVHGVEARAMCPTDQLFHICTHETRWTPVPLPRWIADAIIVLRTSGETIDWDRFAAHAQRYASSLAVREALETIAESIGSEVPANVLARLRQLPISAEEKRRYEARCMPKKDGLLVSLRREYRNMPKQDGHWRPLAFPSYMRELWGLEHMGQLPLRVFRWASRALKRTAGRWTRHVRKRAQ